MIPTKSLLTFRLILQKIKSRFINSIKWLTEAWEWIPIFRRAFWALSKCSQNSVLVTSFCIVEIFVKWKNTNHFQDILFCVSHFSNKSIFSRCWKVRDTNFPKFIVGWVRHYLQSRSFQIKTEYQDGGSSVNLAELCIIFKHK